MPSAHTQTTRGILAGAAALLGALNIACDGDNRPRNTPSGAPASAPTPAASAPADAAGNWNAEQAARALADPGLGLSAALRLVHLSGAAPLLVPPGGDAGARARLRLRSLGDGWWGLGLPDRDPSVLRAPVLLRDDGQVLLPLEGVEEEAARLYISESPRRFPHLLLAPTEARILTADGLEDALRCKTTAGGWLDGRRDGGMFYVALVSPNRAIDGDRGPLRPDEAGRYVWDAYESVFMGPAADVMPGTDESFEIDMSASGAFVPVGGRMPEQARKNTPARPPPSAAEVGPY